MAYSVNELTQTPSSNQHQAEQISPATDKNDFPAILDTADLLSHPADSIRRLAKRLAKSAAEPAYQRTKIKVGIISGFTTDYLTDVLRLMLYRRGFSAEIVSAGYGQIVTEVVSQGPSLSNSPDIVFLLPTHRDLRCLPGLGATREAAMAAAEEEAAFWAGLVGRISAPTVMLSFDQPPYRALGELDGFSPSGVGGHARRTNEILFAALPPTASLIDAEALQGRLGQAWHDAYLYTLCKQPFAMSALPELADTLAASVTARRGKARKLLVLDLDNTVWGGVVGDVGAENLEIGPETPEGEAFTGFQTYVQTLARRGVVLALCSKNNQDIAWSAFRNHPAMVLKEADIAAFVVNFDEKATNIRKIAETLNLGLDSVVFADDNPIERAWVRDQLPDVAVVELPENPALYASAIEAAKLFPMVALTNEDLSRNQSYKAIAVTRAAAEQSLDMESFLSDLKPVAVIEPVGDLTIDRIVQLIAKTNQFKLNPTLFDAAEIRDRAAFTVALRLQDRMQDYGIVAVAVADKQAETLRILNWVMSCRVFSRRVEHAVMEIMTDMAKAVGAKSFVVQFQESPKNGLVPKALQQLGFRQEGAEGNYVALLDANVPPHHMEIQDRRGAS